MSATTGTKIFGMNVRVDQKVILGALGAVVLLALWFNFHGSSDDAPASSSTTITPAGVGSAPLPLARGKGRMSRRQAVTADRGTLRIKPVDASDGRIDPTLRTDLLARLRNVEPNPAGRSLFEAGPSPQMIAAQQQAKIQATKVMVNRPAPVQPMNVTPATPVANIPLRYYGFVNPVGKKESMRGLFMDGDNILVAKEGEQLEGHYLVVALTANTARMEDTRVRLGQILPVTPEAAEQQ